MTTNFNNTVGEFRFKMVAVRNEATNMLPVEYQDSLMTMNALIALGGVKFCSRCKGLGHVTFSAMHGNSLCFKCGGSGFIRFKKTPDEIASLVQNEPKKLFNKIRLQIERNEIKAQKLAEKLAEKKALIEKANEISRQLCLANLSDSERLAFTTIINGQTVLNPVTNKLNTVYANNFMQTLSIQFKNRGYLSEKQIACVINEYAKQEAAKVLKKSFVDYVQGERATVTAHVQNIKEVEVPQYGYYSSGVINKVTMKSATGQYFTVKTNAERLLKVFQAALDENREVTVSGVVKWVSPEQNPVCFTSRGMKVV